MKKSWSKPELLIVVQGSTEEIVLSNCKDYLNNGPSGPCFLDEIWGVLELTLLGDS